MLKYLFLPPLVLAAGCTSVGIYSSNYVGQGITKNTAKFIANDYLSGIKKRFPPATTTILIKKSNTADNFTPLFVDLLRRTGYKVIYTDQPQKHKDMGVALFYSLTPKDDGRISSILQYDWLGEPSYYLRIYQNK
ncbi:hypothetical protein [Bartonella florencae]|uniref:hypothetical protein n=1 Tax=Bartonella florencae TaxID=928210 RepID=UPI0003194427|nr:hypothetical protein [Bartonella florencae]